MSAEQSYDELYDKGFEESHLDMIDNPNVEDVEEEVAEIVEDVEETIENEEETETDVEETEEDSEVEETEDEDIEQSGSENDEETDESVTENDEENSNENSGRTIKWNGQEIFIKNDEIDTFLQKGFDYTKKTQDLAQYRPVIEMMSEGKLSQEDLVTLLDAKNGNADAIAQIMKSANIDLYDINEESNYKPVVNNKNYELEDVINNIKNDTEYGVKVDNYISSLPETTKKYMAENPAILNGFYEDVKNGVADKIMGDVLKTLVLNPNANFVDTYQRVGQEVFQNNQQQEERVQSKQEEKPLVDRETKKKATISKKTKTAIKDHQDVWEDDELFEKMMRMTDPMYRK